MRDLLKLIRWMLLGLMRSRRSLEAENLALRHQLNVLHRRAPTPLCINWISFNSCPYRKSHPRGLSARIGR